MRRFASIGLAFLLTIAASGRAADEAKDLADRAAKGESSAQFELGRRLAAGQGVPKDETAALQWFLKAAAQGHAKAEVGLGSIYAHGFGVKLDWTESIRWYRKAAFQGDTTAQHNLGLDYSHGHGVERDPARAARWFQLGADQGHARCQYNLGELIEEGRGVPKDDLAAYVLYHRAAAHNNLEHLFGQAKMVELIQKRDRVAKRLTPEQIAEGRRRVRAADALEMVNPRRFGAPGLVGPSRGFFIWRKFNPDTWEAEVSREDGNEVWKARVLPWVTTYRYLVYAASPAELLPGERVNIFFSPDENNRRGYLVHFQDEICQMKGHGHYWQIRAVEPNGRKFTARVMAGDKVLDERELSFEIDPKCRQFHDGKPVDKFPLQVGGKCYMTWVMRGEQRVAMLLTDDASLEALKKEEAARVAGQLAVEGMAGRVESVEGANVHWMAYSNHWQQAGALTPGTAGSLQLTGKGYHPQGETVDVHILSQKNRGVYGSGVNDMLLHLDRPDDAKRIESWPADAVVRFKVANR